MDCPDLAEGWWLDPEILVAEVKRHGNRNAAARAHSKQTGSSPSKLANAWTHLGLDLLPSGRRPSDGVGNRDKAWRAGLKVRGDLAELVSEPTPYELGDIEGLLRSRGLNPDDWEIGTATVNEWDSYAGRDEADNEPRVIKLRQLKVTMKRKADIDWLFPAVEVAKRWRPPRRKKKASVQLAVICGDQQAIYQDEGLHQAFCRWLADTQPDLGCLTGDTMDLPTISRHPDRPHWNATPQDCIDGAYRLLSDYQDASPKTRWKKLLGNHDKRLENELLNRAERMYGIAPAAIPDAAPQLPSYSIRNLLHLDALGIELVGIEGEKWELFEMTLAPGVVVRHKLPTKDKANRLSKTIFAGDSHRQSIRSVTFWDDDEPRTETLVEVGCMCERDRRGLGYVDHPDWQAGFATAALGPAGDLVGIDLAKWDGVRLVWRGSRW